MIAKNNVCILIPAYNEEKKVGEVIREVERQGYTVLVVDDGSTDGTPAVIEGTGAYSIFLAKNQGKGAAIRKGFDWVMTNGYEGVIVMDADGQHAPQQLDEFLKVLSPIEADVVVGNRMGGDLKDMPFLRRMTNVSMSALISAVIGQHVPDTQCGFRAFTQEALKRMRLRTSRFEIESEMLLVAGRISLKIKSIPILTVYRGELSHIKPCLDTLRFLNFFMRFIFFKNN